MNDSHEAMLEPKPPEPWHIKREIQVGHIITTVTVVCAMVVYFGKLEQRIALIEQQAIAQHDRDERQDKASNEAISLLRSQLDKIDGKLDRLIDRSKAP